MRRIFIAVKVNPEKNLVSMISSLKNSLSCENIRWVDPANFHVTLSFPGNTDEDKISVLSTLIQENCTGSGEFDFFLQGAGVFKNLREPKVIWAGVQISDALVRLNELVKNGVNKSGINIEDRVFRPHLTLGRLKVLRSETNLKSVLDRYHDAVIQKVTVKEVIVYESILKFSGPQYVPVTKIQLK